MTVALQAKNSAVPSLRACLQDLTAEGAEVSTVWRERSGEVGSLVMETWAARLYYSVPRAGLIRRSPLLTGVPELTIRHRPIPHHVSMFNVMWTLLTLVGQDWGGGQQPGGVQRAGPAVLAGDDPHCSEVHQPGRGGGHSPDQSPGLGHTQDPRHRRGPGKSQVSF